MCNSKSCPIHNPNPSKNIVRKVSKDLLCQKYQILKIALWWVWVRDTNRYLVKRKNRTAAGFALHMNVHCFNSRSLPITERKYHFWCRSFKPWLKMYPKKCGRSVRSPNQHCNFVGAQKNLLRFTSPIHTWEIHNVRKDLPTRTQNYFLPIKIWFQTIF